MPYVLGIDIGTTYTAAAVARGGQVYSVTLGQHSESTPTTVFLREDGGLLVGEAAKRRLLDDPARGAREFKRRLGDTTPILLGGTPYSADRLMAVVLQHVLRLVTEREGAPPDGVVLTHPANWGPFKTDLLRQAAFAVDLDEMGLLEEPVAAAAHYASNERIDIDDLVGVYDLGGGTFDAAVLRRTTNGFERLGEPAGIERLGGIDFDTSVLAHVQTTLAGHLEALDVEDPATQGAFERLRAECIDAKETLSYDTATSVNVSLPGLHTAVRLTRTEFENMIRPAVTETVDALRKAVRLAGIEPSDLRAVLLIGGSSRIPLISDVVSNEMQRPVAVDAHPKMSVAMGAAVASAQGSDSVATVGRRSATAGSPPRMPPPAPETDGDPERRPDPERTTPAPTTEPTPAVAEHSADPPAAKLPPVPPADSDAPGPRGGGHRRIPRVAIGATVVALAVLGIAVLLADDQPPVDGTTTLTTGTNVTTTATTDPAAAAGPGLDELPPGQAGVVIYRENEGTENIGGHLFRVEARTGAEPEDLSAALDPISPLPPGGEDYSGDVTPDGQLLLIHTNRFGCDDPACLVVLPADLTSVPPDKVDLFNDGLPVYVEGEATVSSDGQLIVYPSQDGPHQTDLWAVRKEGAFWGRPALLTVNADTEFADHPSLSGDGSSVVFTCSQEQELSARASVCIVATDGSGWRRLVAPTDHPNHLDDSTARHGRFEPGDSTVVFEATWPRSAIYRVTVDGGQLERVSAAFDEDGAPCALPNGRIASIWTGDPDVDDFVHQIKVMEPDGSMYDVILPDRDPVPVLTCGLG